MNRYDEAALKRQKILDLLWAGDNKGMFPHEVIAALGDGLSRYTASKLLQSMEARGELARTLKKRVVPRADGTTHLQSAFFYTALVRETSSVRSGLADKSERAMPPVRPLWVSGPTDEDRPAIKNQGGQGATIRHYGGSASTTEWASA